MFSAITGLWAAPLPRHAEENDTRQALQRHDPDYERRRRRKKETPDRDMGPDASVVLSVQALRVFLEKFLKSGSGGPLYAPVGRSDFQAPDDYAIQQELDLGGAPGGRVSAEAARAVAVYQTARSVSSRRETILPEATDLGFAAPELDLRAADLRVLYRLAEDLRTLERRGVASLSLPPAESFLESLEAAIDGAFAR